MLSSYGESNKYCSECIPFHLTRALRSLKLNKNKRTIDDVTESFNLAVATFVQYVNI